MNGFTLAKKILRAGYFWMTMENDCARFVQRCHKCQHGTWMLLDQLSMLPPLVIGLFWSPASYKVVTKKVVTDFVRNNLICHFGVPESLITDNGANLKSRLIKEICEQFKITHRNSTVYRPQMNGAVEAANKNIKWILRKMIDNYKCWHENLPYALLGYRTTIRTSTGATRIC
nr:uncharacterized protein K02A2.6-like [Solanum lycopersicum]